MSSPFSLHLCYCTCLLVFFVDSQTTRLLWPASDCFAVFRNETFYRRLLSPWVKVRVPSVLSLLPSESPLGSPLKDRHTRWPIDPPFCVRQFLVQPRPVARSSACDPLTSTILSLISVAPHATDTEDVYRALIFRQVRAYLLHEIDGRSPSTWCMTIQSW